jgi:predicted permease
METLVRDLRHAARVFRASPAIVAIAVVSLAIGIGPTAVLFSLVDALGFRPLPIHEPATLVTVGMRTGNGSADGVSYFEYEYLRDHSRLFAQLAASVAQGFALSGGPEASEFVFGSAVSSTYFPTLGVRAAHGRTFLPEDDRTAGTHPVALISDRLWHRHFSADPEIVGRVVRLNNIDCTVVGVTPPGFTGTQQLVANDVWIPLNLWRSGSRESAAGLEAGGRRRLRLFARLRAGASLDQARAEMAVLGGHLPDQGPAAADKGRRLVLEYEQAARRRPLEIYGLLALVVPGLILLVACANVAGLLLGRAEARRQEIGIRLALGATRRRLVRQLLTESAVLSCLAAAAGLVLAFGIVRLLPRLVPAMPIALHFDLRIDLRVLAATLVVALLAVPLFGLFPALFASRPDVIPLLRGSAPRDSGGRRRLSLRHALVIGQIAVSLALMIASGLLVRSFLNLQGIDPGFVPRPMVLTTLQPGAAGYDGVRTRAFYRQLLERLASTPGVESATMVRFLPLNQVLNVGSPRTVVVPGYELPQGEQAIQVRYNVVGPDYFETMGTRITSGRGFAPSDSAGGRGVALVNQTMARRFWPNTEPIGRHFTVASAGNSSGRDWEVVGVVQDGKYVSLTEPLQPCFYLPADQEPVVDMTVVARVRGDARAMIPVFRREILALAPSMSALRVTTIEDHMASALVVERTIANLVSVLGGSALLLSVVGLYGVISYLVSRRTREIGVRVALGAAPADVAREVLVHGGRLMLAGVVAGVALGLAAMSALAGRLYGVSAWDPLTYGGTTVVVMLVALTATYLPARRAAMLDPLTALRAD